ncbi:MAG TPA: M28 family peptidase, partial [Gemmataceae bacterium]|nr:M28 family peptidase [Gemmataceae bacterium]
LGLSYSGAVSAAPVVFAGYGITEEKEAHYDDYDGLDVDGKVVLVLREAPRAGNREAALPGSRRTAGLVEKLRNAQKHGAVAVLFVNNRELAADGDDLSHYFSFTASVTNPVQMPAFILRRQVADDMLQAAGAGTLSRREEDIDRTLRPHSAELPAWAVSLDVKVRRTLAIKNVVGVLEGAGPLARETVVVGAHYDHLGYGGPGSLSGLKEPAIHHGADDNGSGATALMELARHFAQQPHRQGRRLVFIAFSGEEMGLYGSAHYCKEPLFPLADTAAMVNLDMVGRLRADPQTKKDKLIMEGTGTAREFGELLDRLNAKHDFRIKRVASGFGPSDHASFYARQVPVLFFFTDDHADYHRPSDTADKINMAGMERVLAMAEDLIAELAATPQRPRYVKVAGSTSASPGDFPKVGIRPAYSDDKEGVLLDGVSDGGPAAKAGLKEGDRIVEMDGRPVKSLEGYMTLIRTHKRGKPIELGVLRGGKRLTVKVTPE